MFWVLINGIAGQVRVIILIVKVLIMVMICYDYDKNVTYLAKLYKYIPTTLSLASFLFCPAPSAPQLRAILTKKAFNSYYQLPALPPSPKHNNDI